MATKRVCKKLDNIKDALVSKLKHNGISINKNKLLSDESYCASLGKKEKMFIDRFWKFIIKLPKSKNE